MDWSKAKNVLIILFISLNIFLAANRGFFDWIQSDTDKNISNTVKIMEERGYTLLPKIPTVKESYKLMYEENKLDRNLLANILIPGMEKAKQEIIEGKPLEQDGKTLTFTGLGSFVYENKTPKENVQLSDNGKVEKLCIEFIDSLKLPISEYRKEDTILNANGTVTLLFNEKFKDYIIFSNELKVTVSIQGITRVTCNIVKVKDFILNTKATVVPAYQVLLVNFKKSDKAVIKNIEIGFDCSENSEGKSFWKVPIWRIKMKDHRYRDFKVANGEEILYKD